MILSWSRVHFLLVKTFSRPQCCLQPPEFPSSYGWLQSAGLACCVFFIKCCKSALCWSHPESWLPASSAPQCPALCITCSQTTQKLTVGLRQFLSLACLCSHFVESCSCQSAVPWIDSDAALSAQLAQASRNKSGSGNLWSKMLIWWKFFS